MKSNWKTVAPDVPTPIDKKIENQWIPTVFAEPAVLGFHIRKWTPYKLNRINWDSDGQPFQYVAWFSILTACSIGCFTIERVQLPESVPQICYCTIPVLSKNNSWWIFYFCWPDLQLERDIRTCNAVISSCEKAAKWCLRRHQLIAASFLYTPFALEKWHRETNICINWSTYEVLEDTSMMYCMPRSVFLFFNPAVSSTKGRSFAAFGRCNYTKSLISTNRHWLAEQLSNDIKIYALNWRGHTRHGHTLICPWLKLTIYMCIFDHICWIHIHSSLIFWLSSSDVWVHIGRWIYYDLLCVYTSGLKYRNNGGGSLKSKDSWTWLLSMQPSAHALVVAWWRLVVLYYPVPEPNVSIATCAWSESHLDMEQNIGLMKMIRDPDCQHGYRENDSNNMITIIVMLAVLSYHSKIMFSMSWAARKRQKHMKPLCTLN